MTRPGRGSGQTSARGTFAAAAVMAMLWMDAGSAGAQPAPGLKFSRQEKAEQLGPDHYRLSGNVEGELEREGLTFAADLVDYYTDTGRLIATGHVVVITRDSHISADRADIDTRRRIGLYYQAFGTATVPKEQGDPSLFGTQEPLAYFYGETIERVGPDKYVITRGGFTTCVQPTPRWEAVTSKTTVRLDRYALLTNAVLKVKDVPLFYLPVMYYPIQADERATGFLMPVYGNTTVRGQSVSNAFFWAINRSQDATFVHDWLPSAGQGYGAEYRYVSSPASNGSLRLYRLDERARNEQPARESFNVLGSSVQRLPGRLMARANVNYFSDVTVQQAYQQDWVQATLRNRSYGGNLSGSWGRDSLSLTYETNEVFYDETSSLSTGSRPRLTWRRSATPLGPLPIFFSSSAEVGSLARTQRAGDVVVERDLSRMDLTPSLQFPFTRWPFLTVQSSLEWHNTYYTRSQDAEATPIDEPLLRQYVLAQSRFVGPTLARVWNTPENGYAERYKHVIEPELTISRTSAFDNEAIIKLDSGDYAYGGTTRVTYGVTQRLLAKRRTGTAAGTDTTRTHELLTLQVVQSYYSDERASQVDGNFNGAFLGRPPSHFSPVAMTLRASPSELFNSSLRLEYNTDERLLESASADGTVRLTSWLSTGASYSQVAYPDPNATLQGSITQYLGTRTTVSTRGGRLNGSYAFEMNVAERHLNQQRLVAAYNAQCCGIAIEYQRLRLPESFGIPQDHRLNLSFTLAGIGSFSNFLGAFGIGQGASGSGGQWD